MINSYNEISWRWDADQRAWVHREDEITLDHFGFKNAAENSSEDFAYTATRYVLGEEMRAASRRDLAKGDLVVAAK